MRRVEKLKTSRRKAEEGARCREMKDEFAYCPLPLPGSAGATTQVAEFNPEPTMQNQNAANAAAVNDEIERIDRNWLRDRQAYLLPRRSGELLEPTPEFARFQRIAGVLLAGAVNVAALIILFNRLEMLLLVLALSGLGFFLGWLLRRESERTMRKAIAFRKARASYLARRDQALRQ
jgi:hypothetical protein